MKKKNKYISSAKVIHMNNRCLITIIDDYYDDYDYLYIISGIYRKFSKRRKDYKRIGIHHGKLVNELFTD